ncbi:MAG: hypothetical protein MI920_35140 [Kiloniellales bacterium]|nr:hypothetical protein [Kiloniellales bacterium]
MPWALPDSDSARLALAKAYPFSAPRGSYVFARGEAHPLTEGTVDPGLFQRRRPVLAHGSNRSPDQLRRKYGESAMIPVTVGWLEHYDVVYSAHVTQYGAIASTLQHVHGVRARVAVTWLTEEQLARMHETEGPSTYRYGHLRGVRLVLDGAPAGTLTDIDAYLSSNGCLAREGEAIGLAAIEAEGRPHPELSQEAVLLHVRDRYRPGADLDAMILRKISDKALRQALVEEMRAEAVPAETPHFQEVGR